MSAEMTPRERICAAFEHREPDRVPAYDLLRNEGAIAHYAGQAVTYDNWQEVVPRAVSRCLDLTRSMRGPSRPERIEGPDGSVTVVERWTTWHPVKRHRTDEALRGYFETVARSRPSDADLAAQADERVHWHLDWAGRMAPCLQVWQIGGVGLHGAHGVAGLELFSYLWHDHPEVVLDYLAAVTDRHRRLVETIFRRHDRADLDRLAPVAFVGDDIAYKTGPMFSTPDLERLFFPHLATLCETYHEHGIWAMFHSDGNLNPIMDRLVECGIDGLNPIERNADMDLAELKQKYGDKVTFCGGVDIHRLVRYGSTAEVVAGTRQAVLDAGRDGGYLCGSSTELDDDLPAANVIAMLETIRHQGSYRALAAEVG